MRRPSLTYILIGLIVAAFAAVFIVGIGLYLNQDTIPLFSTEAWRLTSEGEAQILWQFDTSCLKDSRTPNGVLAVVGTPALADLGNQVVFHQDCAPGIAVLKAVDIVTGEMRWWAKSPSSSQLVPAWNSVINVEDGTRLVSYDLSGRERWRSVDFPTQILRVSADPFSLFVIQTDSMTGLSLPTGRQDPTREDNKFLQTFGGISVMLNDTGFEVTRLGKDDALTFDLPQILTVPRESIWVDGDENTLVISPTAGLVRAYDLEGGRSLWTIETQALSAPLIGGDHVYLYTAANTLDVYELRTGERVASLGLERAGGYTGSVDLAYRDGIVVMAFPEVHEIIAVRMQRQ